MRQQLFHLSLPRVAWFLWAAALQFLHQHLAAASQSISDFPERAAAPQGAAPVLQGAEKQTKDYKLLL